jgi:hypothetical protein
VLCGKAVDAPPTTAARRPAATGPTVPWPASRGFLVARPIGAARNQQCCSARQRRGHGRCPVTPRRRTDLTLLLIIRRAERDAGMPSRPRWEEPDTPTGIDPGRDPNQSESPRPS